MRGIDWWERFSRQMTCVYAGLFLITTAFDESETGAVPVDLDWWSDHSRLMATVYAGLFLIVTAFREVRR